eukprot:TRINITY_DN10476_c0_g1_i12.p2 TRINITY_DN10476_c0_g1~~TRINITY_DN10476_c0_g1_i12.p2  ORF type:complete len:124 (+),score=10.58 TRINITY_DN10476_c0_g1_i12:126-497(+)
MMKNARRRIIATSIDAPKFIIRLCLQAALLLLDLVVDIKHSTRCVSPAIPACSVRRSRRAQGDPSPSSDCSEIGIMAARWGPMRLFCCCWAAVVSHRTAVFSKIAYNLRSLAQEAATSPMVLL